MKYSVKIKTNAKKNKVTVVEKNQLMVCVNVPPIEGRANEKLIELLSDYFHKPKRSISIVSGLKSKNKIISIAE